MLLAMLAASVRKEERQFGEADGPRSSFYGW